MLTGKRMAAIAAVALVMGGAGAGCASNGPYAHAPRVTRPNTVTLRVRNNHWQDVRVYLLRGGGSPIRVGYVGGLSSETIRLRQPLNGRAQLLLRPLGTRATFITNVVTVGAGERLELTVQNSLSQSSLIRR